MTILIFAFFVHSSRRPSPTASDNSNEDPPLRTEELYPVHLLLESVWRMQKGQVMAPSLCASQRSMHASLTCVLADDGQAWQAMGPDGPGRTSTNFWVSVANVGSTADQPTTRVQVSA